MALLSWPHELASCYLLNFDSFFLLVLPFQLFVMENVEKIDFDRSVQHPNAG